MVKITVDDVRNALKEDGFEMADAICDKEAINLATLSGVMDRLFQPKAEVKPETDYKASVDRTMKFLARS